MHKNRTDFSNPFDHFQLSAIGNKQCLYLSQTADMTIALNLHQLSGTKLRKVINRTKTHTITLNKTSGYGAAVSAPETERTNAQNDVICISPSN